MLVRVVETFRGLHLWFSDVHLSIISESWQLQSDHGDQGLKTCWQGGSKWRSEGPLDTVGMGRTHDTPTPTAPLLAPNAPNSPGRAIAGLYQYKYDLLPNARLAKLDVFKFGFNDFSPPPSCPTHAGFLAGLGNLRMGLGVRPVRWSHDITSSTSQSHSEYMSRSIAALAALQRATSQSYCPFATGGAAQILFSIRHPDPSSLVRKTRSYYA